MMMAAPMCCGFPEQTAESRERIAFGEGKGDPVAWVETHLTERQAPVRWVLTHVWPPTEWVETHLTDRAGAGGNVGLDPRWRHQSSRLFHFLNYNCAETAKSLSLPVHKPEPDHAP